MSHGLWAGAAAQVANNTGKIRLRYWWAFFWGAFPDLFAFTVPMIWMIGSVVTGAHSWADFHNRSPDAPPMNGEAAPMVLAAALYNVSHSLVIFALSWAVLWMVTKKHPFILGGWLLHILADVPTHTHAFFPTPVLWPISQVSFDGISWGTPWFLTLDYALLLITYTYLWKRRKRTKIQDEIIRSGKVMHTE